MAAHELTPYLRTCLLEVYPCTVGSQITWPLQLCHQVHTSLPLTPGHWLCGSVAQWFGEAEKYVKAVFTLAAKISPCVIFVDEVRRRQYQAERSTVQYNPVHYKSTVHKNTAKHDTAPGY